MPGGRIRLSNPKRAGAETALATGRSAAMNIIQDVRYALRTLRKNPVFTAVAIVVVALGTGAVSTIFSVANSVMLRPVPGVERPADIATIERTRTNGSGALSASYSYYQDVAARSHTLQGVAAWSILPMTVNARGQGVSALGNIVSGNYFDVLGVRPALGRFFQGAERDVVGQYPVAVISHNFWQRQFAGDSTIVGRSILINGVSFTIIGVTPNRFSGLYPVLRTDAWIPLMMQPQVRSGRDLLSAGAAWLEMFGRVAAGATLAQANVEVAALTRQRATNPAVGEPGFMAAYAGARLQRLAGFPDKAVAPITAFIVVLFAVATLVLLIASVNVASMLLARAVARQREIAVRVALGAGRARLVAQMLTESVVLFVAGGLAGTLLAVYGTRALQAIELPVDVPMVLDLAPDWRVVVFTLVVALITGLLFGLAPALRGSRLPLAAALRNDNVDTGRGRSRLRNGLVAGQVALSLLLLTVSGLFVRALDKGKRVDVGIDVRNVATAALNVGSAGYDSARARLFYRELAARLANVAGVERVAFASILPLSMNSMGVDISIPGYVPTESQDGRTFSVLNNVVDDGYFAVTKMPVASGRTFRSSDNETAAPVVVVNETFARKYWPANEAVGRQVELDGNSMTVVGVVRDSKYSRLDESDTPFIFLPYAQHWHSDVHVLVRTRSDASQFSVALGRALHALDASLPEPTVTTLQQATSVVLLPQRAAVFVTGALGIVGLVLAGIGLYGVISFSTERRTREIGVRVALGADRRDVVRLVVGEGMKVVAIGIAIGLALAFAATRALASFLFGVSPLDGITFIAAALILTTVALLASYLPARRAAMVDPMTALRQQ